MRNARLSLWIGLLLWVGLVIVVCVNGELPVRESVTSAERFEQVKYGMTLSEVEMILGPGGRVDRPAESEKFRKVSGDPAFHERERLAREGNCTVWWTSRAAAIEIGFQGPLAGPQVSSLSRREFTAGEIRESRVMYLAGAAVAVLGLGLVVHGLWPVLRSKPAVALNSPGAPDTTNVAGSSA